MQPRVRDDHLRDVFVKSMRLDDIDTVTLYDPSGESCPEKNVLYKLISGLHSSISVHVATDYQLDVNTNLVVGENGTYAKLIKMQEITHETVMNNAKKSSARLPLLTTPSVYEDIANRSEDFTIGSSKLSDIVLEASKWSKEIITEASKKADLIKVEESKHADQIKS
ncbi:hypothetical protein L1987_54699 [Smallanthus sonchifolius]|uniref:Uncharacterized protein n=1 Tax=Smallanthus sonchifolius TaxID=185202 RepID=A0ACB9E7V5_9ASTR|nr:hypothetical protein L1987_54699 [Smallanthus sonchifolius]